MSHYNNKKIEIYEDALFALLMDQLAEEQGEKYMLLNEELKNDPQYKVPDEFSKACYRTISKESAKKQRKALAQTSLKLFQRVSMLAVIIAILFTSALAISPSLRSHAANWALEILYDHTNISFPVPNAAEGDIDIRWIPQGYHLTSKEGNIWEFSDTEENWIFLITSPYSGSEVNLDTEDADLIENIQIANQRGIYIEKEDTKTLIWASENGTHAISIYANALDRDTMIRFAQNIFSR